MKQDSATEFAIAGRPIGPGHSTYVIAELSANHNGDYDQAVELLHACADAGADAVKLQTYTADTLTIDCDNEHFKIGPGTLWEGRTLYDLYGEAHTPWEWQPRLMELAQSLGVACFSTPFDATAIDFLEQLKVPAHKVASFEMIDLPLLARIGATRKPVIMSTGMASEQEVADALATLQEAGAAGVAVLKCTSAYPAPPESMNLSTIPYLAERFGVPAGLSDHTLGIAVPVAAVALGATIIEKHVTLGRTAGGPDAAFSLEPQELKQMIDAVRAAELAIGKPTLGGGASEQACTAFRRSLFVVEDIRKGQPLCERNVRSIRPGGGLPPKELPRVLGRIAGEDIPRGTPLEWRHVA